MGVVKQFQLEELEHEHLENEIKEYLLAHGAFDVSVVDCMSISFPSNLPLPSSSTVYDEAAALAQFWEDDLLGTGLANG